MLDLFPNREVPDFSLFDTSPFNLDYFDVDGWNSDNGSGTYAVAGTSPTLGDGDRTMTGVSYAK